MRRSPIAGAAWCRERTMSGYQRGYPNDMPQQPGQQAHTYRSKAITLSCSGKRIVCKARSPIGLLCKRRIRVVANRVIIYRTCAVARARRV